MRKNKNVKQNCHCMRDISHLLPGSIQDVLNAIASCDGTVRLDYLSKPEKRAWITQLIDKLNYDTLSRDHKGSLRQYIQNETGYSRAQTARLIKRSKQELAVQSLLDATEGNLELTPKQAYSLTAQRYAPLTRGVTALGLVLSLAWAGGASLLSQSDKSALEFLNAQVTSLYDSLGAMDSVLPVRTAVHTEVEGESYPLFVQQEDIGFEDGTAVGYEKVTTISLDELEGHVAKRRRDRQLRNQIIEQVAKPAAARAERIANVLQNAIQAEDTQQINGRIISKSSDSVVERIASPRALSLGDSTVKQEVSTVQIRGQTVNPEAVAVATDATSTVSQRAAARRANRIIGAAVSEAVEEARQVAEALQASAPQPEILEAPSIAPVPNIWNAVGGGKNGQVLMMVDNTPIWTYLNPSNIKSLPSGYVSRRGGGSGRGGGGGSSGGSSGGGSGARGPAGAQGPQGEAGPTLGIYDSLGLTSTGDRAAGDAGGRDLYNVGLLTASGRLIVEGNARFNSGVILNSVTYNFPGNAGTNNQVLSTDGNGNLTWVTVAGVGTDYFAGQGLSLDGNNFFSLNSVISGSLVNFVTVSGAQVHAQDSLTSSGLLAVDGDAFFNNEVTFGSGITINGVTYIFPFGDGSSSGKVLATDGSGNLTWTTAATNLIAGQGLTIADGVVSLNAVHSGTTIEATVLLSGAHVHAQNTLTSSGTLTVEGATVLNDEVTFGSGIIIQGVTYRFPIGDGSASGKVLKTDGNGNLSWSDDIDTDNDTTYTAGQGIELNGTVFSLAAAHSGTTIEATVLLSGAHVHAQNALTSSGTLTVEGVTVLNDEVTFGSGIIIQGVTYRFPIGDGSASGKVLKTDGNGNLTWSDDTDTTIADTDTTYTAGQGIELNGTVFSLAAVHSGTTIEATVLLSGAHVHAQNRLTSSGTLAVDGDAFFNNEVTFGSGIIINGVTYVFPFGDGASSGKVLATDGSGNLSWTTAATNLSASQGLSISDGFVGLNASFSGTVIEAETLLSGASIRAQDYLASSGTLAVDGDAFFNNEVVFGSGIIIQGVTYRFPIGDGSASGKVLKTDSNGNLSWSDDIDTTIADTDTTYTAGQGIELNGTVFSLAAVHSGTVIEAETLLSGASIRAQDYLASSGTLAIEGETFLGDEVTFGSGLIINGVTYRFPGDAGSANQVLHTDGNGNLSWQDDDSGAGSLSPGQGLNITSGFVGLNANHSGATIEATVLLSGAHVHAQNGLTTSGALQVEGTATIQGTLSGNTISGFNLTDCDGDGQTLGWDATTQTFVCGDDDTGGSSLAAGQGLTIQNGFVVLNSTLTGSIIEAFTLLSGASVHAQDRLTSSGTLAVDGDAFFNNEVTFGSGIIIQGVTYRFPIGDGSASGKVLKTDSNGNLSWSDDIDTDTDTTYTAGQGIELNGTVFSLAAVHSGTTIEATVLLSGASVHAQDRLTSSGTLAVDGDAFFNNEVTFGSGIIIQGVTYRFPIGDGAASGKVLKTDSNGNLSWSDDIDTTIADTNTTYIAGQGIELNGTVFSLSETHSGTTVEATVLLSGAHVHAQNTLTSSGKLVVRGASTLSGAVTIKDDLTVQSGAFIQGTLSGHTIAGFNLTDCDGDAQTLGWDATTQTFVCGDDDSGGAALSAGQGLTIDNGFVFLNSTISGSVIEAETLLSGASIRAQDLLASSGTLVVEGLAVLHDDLTVNSGAFVRGLLSGWSLHASDRITASGTIAVEGDAFFNNEVTFGSGIIINGVTYVFPFGDGSSSGKVLATDGEGNLSWTTAATSLAAGQGLSIQGGFVLLNSTISGSIIEAITLLSGAHVHAQNTLTSSGTLVVRGTSTLSGAVTVKDDLTVQSGAFIQGTLSGHTIAGFNLTDCDGDAQTLGWDATTQTFVCGDDDSGGSSLAAGQGLTVQSGFVFLNSTFSGSVIEAVTLLSGAHVHAQHTLTSSGTLVVRGTSTLSGAVTVKDDLTVQSGAFIQGTLSGNTIAGFNLTDCDADNQTLGWDADTQRFVCGDDDSGGGGLAAGQGLTVQNGFVFLNASHSGTVIEATQLLSGAHVHAQDRLTSSGIVVFESNEKQGSGVLSITAAERQSGAYIFGSGAPLLALDSYEGTQSGTTAHVAFGYNGFFDVSLYRSGIDGNQSGSGGLVLKTMQRGADQNAFQIITENGSAHNRIYRVTASGAVHADGAFNSTGADYAEYFFSKHVIEKGEVVCVDLTRDNAVVRCSNEADENVMGIASSNPAFIGNKITGAGGIMPPGYYLVGLIGQVPTRVLVAELPSELEDGEPEVLTIRPGDSLTPASIPGYARRALPGEPTIGVALEGFQGGSGDRSVVNVLISRNNSSDTVTKEEEDALRQIAALEIEDKVGVLVAEALVDVDVSDEIAAELDEQLGTLDLAAAINEERIDFDIDAIVRPVVEDVLALHASAGEEEVSIGIVEALQEQLDLLNTDFEAKLEELEAKLNERDRSFDSLVAEDAALIGGPLRAADDVFVEGTLHADDLFIPGLVVIDGSLDVAGALKAGSFEVQEGATIHGPLTIGGKLMVDGKELDLSGLVSDTGFVNLRNLLVQNSLNVLGDVTIEGIVEILGDVVVRGTLTASGSLKLSNNQAGYAVVVKTGTAATVAFGSGFYEAPPIVTATPEDFVEWRLRDVTQEGFTIEVEEPAQEDTVFHWHAMITNVPITHKGLPGGASPNDTAFLIDKNGVPISSSAIWNACIRNQQPLDPDGKPSNCRRYRDDGNMWTHPDHLIQFMWDPDAEGLERIALPQGFYIDVVDVEAVMPEEEEGEEEEETEESEEGEEVESEEAEVEQVEVIEESEEQETEESEEIEETEEVEDVESEETEAEEAEVIEEVEVEEVIEESEVEEIEESEETEEVESVEEVESEEVEAIEEVESEQVQEVEEEVVEEVVEEEVVQEEAVEPEQQEVETEQVEAAIPEQQEVEQQPQEAEQTEEVNEEVVEEGEGGEL